jgi:drug/metabolite transporter (DMT)-like permease
VSQPVYHVRAILYALAGFTCWVASDTLLKLIGEGPVPKYELMAVSSIGGMTIIAAFTLFRGGIGKLRPNGWKGLFILGLLHLANFSFWIMALTRLPLANLYTVAFLSPIVVSILAAVFLREPITWKHGIAIAAGFVGVVIAVNPVQLLQHANKSLAYGFVFGSMVLLSVMMLILRILGRSESRECTAFYPRVVILIGSVLATFIVAYKPMTAGIVIVAALSGGAGSLGWLLMAHAYKLAPAATVAPFHYSEIVTGALAGYLIWHDVPSMHVLAGAAIIVSSGIYIITHTRKSPVLLKEESHA